MPAQNLQPGIMSPEMYAATVEAMKKDRKFLPSDNFIIGCGCVTLDPVHKRVLLVLNHKYDIHQLPKGRKNIGEDLLSAAVREVFEETGYHPTVLRAKIPTRATPVVMGPDDPEVTEDVECCEPVAACHYPDPYSGALKMVFYFLAVGNSSAEQVRGTQDDWERLEAIWAPVEKAADMLAFEEDGNVVKRALEVARANGVDI